MNLKKSKKHKRYHPNQHHDKNFSDYNLDKVLSKIEKFDADEIRVAY